MFRDAYRRYITKKKIEKVDCINYLHPQEPQQHGPEAAARDTC